MNTERITVTAADLQPGDVVVEAPRYAAMIGPGHVVERVTPFVDVDSYFFKPADEFIVDRPVPTTTLTFDVPESKREAVEQAVRAVLDPPVKVGDRVRRTLPQTRADGGTGWQYEPGATGTVTYLYLKGEAAVLVDNDGRHGFERIWRAGSFEVVPS